LTSTWTTATLTPTTRTRSAEALSRCLEPVEVSRFLDEHWERRPLFVERDEPGRYDDLLTPGDVEHLVEAGGLRTPAFRLVRADERLKASEFAEDVPWRPLAFTGMPNVARIAAEFDRGATLVVQGMHHWWPPLAAFCRSLEAGLAHPAQANAYFTPRSAQGLPIHHDTHDVFCLQLAGEKRWLVYEPAWELPLRDQKYDPAMGAPAEAVLDVVLRPGDTLYLPRGWLHAAATSDEESLHLTIGVNVYTWIDALRAALGECADDVRFRRSADDGDPQALVDALAERLRPDDVRRRRRAKLAATRRPILDGQFDALRTLRALDVETELERRATALAELDGTRLVFDGRTLAFPQHVREELEYLVTVDTPFRAADIPGRLDDAGRLTLVRRLVREGLLRPTQ
jgi:lysine-specific demethylase/histidyl-hydroxylase NO66